MNNRPKTKIPVKIPQRGANKEDDTKLKTTCSSLQPGYERITYYPRGQNWRYMLDNVLNCDITIDVDGNLIMAHKCVLISRCRYFASLFSGKSKDSITRICLDGFSFDCVRYAINVIYSGVSDIPKNLDAFELADLGELLNFDGLKDLISYELETKYFHSFHKPCEECACSVSKFLPWSGAVEFSDLYHKIILWIKLYCNEIWANKEFALLPYDVINKCFRYYKMDIDTENVLEVVRRCEKLMATLPKVAWTLYIFRLSLQLLRECVHYMSGHLADVLSTESFLLLGKEDSEKTLRLEDRITAAIEHANPLQVCAAYAQLHRLLRAPVDQTLSKWWDLSTRLAIHCEDALISCASQAMSTSAWVSLQPDLQARIKKYSGILPITTLSQKKTNKFTREKNMERIKFILYSQLGEINRVPLNPYRQHLPAPTASKCFFVAPGNSMVTSTKTTNISNRQNSHNVVPSNHNAQYKHVKARYLNPKPDKHENPDMSKQPISNNVMKNSKKPSKSTKIEDPKKKVCKTTYTKNISAVDRKKLLESRIKPKIVNPTQKSNDTKKPKCTNEVVENETKTPTKKPPVSYVSPFSFTPSSNQIPSNTTNQKSTEALKESPKGASMHTTKNRCLTGSMSADTKNISVSDTALSVKSKKSPKDSMKNTRKKSPTFRQLTHENSSSYSSSISHSSTIFGNSKSHPNSTKNLSPNNVKNQTSTNYKAKNLPSFIQWTVSSGAKITQKSSVNDVFPNPQIASTSTQTIISCDMNSGTTENVDALPNENNTSAMSRSRTFLKKEASIISKEITSDASIDMYPK